MKKRKPYAKHVAKHPTICIECNRLFLAVRASNIKYCSLKCCDRFYAKTHRAEKAKRTREYGYKKFGWKPKPTEPIACPAPDCKNMFVPKTSWQKGCSKKCRTKLHYDANPEYHAEKTKRTRLKTHSAWKARGRATWAEMKAQRGTMSRFAKARQPWLPILSGIRHRSLKKQLPFDLTREWCETRWTGRCELTGIEFALNTTKRDSFAPSIDKINPNEGYMQSNCRFVLWAINAFKFTGTDETMYDLARTLIAAKTDGSINSILSLPC